MRVFLSYGRPDRARVEQLALALTARGHLVWWDRQIAGGSAFAQEIERELTSADRVIVAWSVHSVTSDWVRDEASDARDRGVLLPVLLDGTPAPLGFRQYQAIDLSGWDGSADGPGMDALDGALGGQPPPGRAPPAASAPAPVHASRRRLWPMAGAGVAAALAAAWFGLRPGTVAADPQPHVALGRFAIASAGLPQGFADQLRNETLAAFGTDSRVDVIPAENARPGAWQLSGTAVVAGDTVRIIAQLVEPTSKAVVWTPRIERSRAELAVVPTAIGADLASGVRCVLRGARARPALQAAALSLWGKFCAGLVDNDRATALSQAASALERLTATAPKFAAGWSSLAELRMIKASTEYDPAGAEVAARAALALDPREATGLQTLADLALRKFEFAKAETLLRQAITLNAADCGCQHSHYAGLLGSLGRTREAAAEADKAIGLEPLDAGNGIFRAYLSAVMGDNADADQRIRNLAGRISAAPLATAAYFNALYAGRYGDLPTLAVKSEDDGMRGLRTAVADALATPSAAATARAATALDAYADHAGERVSDVVTLMFAIGRDDAALALAAREVAGGRPWLLESLYEPTAARSRRSLAFEPILRRFGVLDYWRASGRPPDFCNAADAPPLCATLRRKS